MRENRVGGRGSSMGVSPMSASAVNSRARRPCHGLCGALLRKEWQEQRWRFFLGTVVLGGLLGGMLRAQIVPPHEAAMLIYWPVGIVMVIFLAMGPVASERADRTWEFLVARPVSRADVLLAKWAMGAVHLVAMIVIATIAGMIALASRGFYGPTTLLKDQIDPRFFYHAVGFIQWAIRHQFAWLCMLALAATIALVSWYTLLFLLLSRARNEFAAALGGILLTIALHAWLAQFLAAEHWRYFLIPAMLNPIALLALAVHPLRIDWIPVIAVVHVLLWIVLPLSLARRIAKEAAEE
jgi:ABC-type Na+ efflux pump permease subunit